MRLLTRIILILAVAVLGGIQAVILTLPVTDYCLRPKINSGDIFGTGASIVSIFVCVIVFAVVFSSLFVFLMIGYRESMAARLRWTSLTLAASVCAPFVVATYYPNQESLDIGVSAAAFFIGMLWTFIGTRKSVT